MSRILRCSSTDKIVAPRENSERDEAAGFRSRHGPTHREEPAAVIRRGRYDSRRDQRRGGVVEADLRRKVCPRVRHAAVADEDSVRCPQADAAKPPRAGRGKRARPG